MPFYPAAPTLQLGRIDQGVDWSGHGGVFAVESGTIINLTTPGWPGGTMMVLLLDTPRDGRHRAVYYAEDITIQVAYGQHVDGFQQLGYAYGGPSGIEIGWASTQTVGNTLQSDSGPYGGSGPTPEGEDFAAWISNAPTPVATGPGGQQAPPANLPVELAWENYRNWATKDFPDYLIGGSWIQAAIDQF